MAGRAGVWPALPRNFYASPAPSCMAVSWLRPSHRRCRCSIGPNSRIGPRTARLLLLLDGVGNPHNFGAIARTAAFFGFERMVLSDHAGQAGARHDAQGL